MKRALLLSLSSLACNNAVPVEDLPAEQAAALCDLYVRCGVATDEALCAGDMWSTYNIIAAFTPNMASLTAAIDRGSVRYRGDRVEACLAGIRETACTTTDFWLLFERALGVDCVAVFEGTLAEGEPCSLHQQCISRSCETRSCELACCEGVCGPERARAAVGEDCAYAECVEGAHCVAAVCVARQPSGAACAPPEGDAASSECIEGTLCADNHDGTGTCRPLPALGEPCLEGKCADLGAACDYTMGICVQTHAEGEACDPSAFGSCGLGLRCDHDRRLCERMTAGDPCSFGAFGYDCAPGTHCGNDLICEAQQAAGAPCEDSSVCESLYCDPVTHTCGDPPVCEP